VPILTASLSTLLAGFTGDRLGRRLLLQVSTLIFTPAAIAPFWLTDLTQIVISRALAGCAIGFMMTSAVALIGDYFEGPARQRWLSVQSGASSACAVFGAGASGALATIDWRAPFLLPAIGFLVFAALLVFPVPLGNSSEIPNQVDRPQAAAKAKWTSFAPVFGLAMSAALILYPIGYALGLLLEEKKLRDVLLTGLAASILGVGGLAGAVGLAALKRLGPAAKQGVAFALGSIGLASAAAAQTLPVLLAGVFAVGLGQGMTLPTLSGWLLEMAPPDLRARTIGLFQTIFFLFGFAAPLASQKVFQLAGSTAAGIGWYAIASAAAAPGALIAAKFVRSRRVGVR
jgi:MFS family permease